MIGEANCLYWATGMMSHTYLFVDECLQEHQRQGVAIPNNIPRLRVVKACLAIPESKDPNGAIYLLEEKIPGKFTKYINNNEAIPNSTLTVPSSINIAEFLCFAQHVQYIATGKKAFLSDFQGVFARYTSELRGVDVHESPGAGEFLTDCQVITSG